MKGRATIVFLALSVISAPAKDVPRKCMDGTTSNFIAGTAIPTNQLSRQLPRAEYEGRAIDFEDKKAHGKVLWGEMPAGAKTNIARIAEYRGHAIYCATYEWAEDGGTSRCIVLSYCDDGVAITRPFFIASDQQLSSVEARITSAKAERFGLEVQICWKGTGVMWASFAYRFDSSGPRLISRTMGGRHQDEKTRRY